MSFDVCFWGPPLCCNHHDQTIMALIVGLYYPYNFDIDGLVQERCNSIANALELRLSCTNPSIWRICRFRYMIMMMWQFFFFIVTKQIHPPKQAIHSTSPYHYHPNFVTKKSADSGGHIKNTYEPSNLRALKFSLVDKIHIFQCMGKIFCVEFQRVPLKFRTKCLTHTLKDTKGSLI